MKNIDRKKRIQVIVSCAGLAASSLGLIINVFGVFFTPLSSALHSGRGTISLASTLTSLFLGFASALTVKTVQEKPLQKVLLLSVTITCLSTIGLAYSKNLLFLYVFSILRGFCASFFTTHVVAFIISRWFISDRGTITGLVMAFSGIAGALMSPILNQIIDLYGYRFALILSAVLIFLFSLPAILTLSSSPEKEGYLPYERKEKQKDGKDGSFKQIEFSRNSSVFISLMIVSFIIQFLCSICQHLSGYGQSLGFSSAQGAMMISAAMIGNISGKFLSGILSDRIGAVKACIVLLIGFLTGLFILMNFQKEYLLMLVGSLLLGMSYAGAISLSNVCFSLYDSRDYGSAYSTLTIIINTSGAIAVSLIGYAYDVFSSYQPILILCLGMGIIALLCMIYINRKTSKQKGQ
ncbi:MAG: MFS transporter [Erysipelotrichaceae bacterium]|nr:MFS transporter [Erysipelotrichaceae bacterium]